MVTTQVAAEDAGRYGVVQVGDGALRRSIPFENLDVILGRGVSVALSDVQRKRP
jgi:arylamine N-acetyltransferase